MVEDARKAKTMDEAARNPNGTYNGARALSWLSEVLCPGKGVSEAEVMRMWEAEKAKRLLTEKEKTDAATTGKS